MAKIDNLKQILQKRFDKLFLTFIAVCIPTQSMGTSYNRGEYILDATLY